jgi:hypothetical protein
MNFESLNYFLGIRPQCRGVAWAGALLWRLGATAWRPIGQPGPAVMAATGRARWGAVTAAEAGAVAWAATTRLPRGRGQGHEGGGRGAPGKMRNGAAHRGGRASVR